VAAARLVLPTPPFPLNRRILMLTIIRRREQSVRDPLGVPRTLEVVAVVKGVARAQRAVDDFTKRLTEEERKSGVFYCWEYTSREIGRE
jgi:hypothetical protein